MTNSTQPRGIRNNNPLNIRRSNNAWLGKIPASSDPQFEQFVTMEHGVRAAMVNMRTIIKRHKNACTLRRLINTWAPPSDGNNTDYYVTRVALGAHLSPCTYVDMQNKIQIIDIVYMMAWVECGQPIKRDIIERAYDML